MTTEKTPMIFGCLADINTDLDAIGKNGKTQFGESYNYRKVDDLLNHMGPLLKKHRVIISPKVIETIKEDRTTSKGGYELYLRLMIEYTFFATDGSSLTVGPILGEGMDGRDKAANKAMSAAFKIAMFQTFAIAIEAVDSEAGEQQPVTLRREQQPTGSKQKSNAPAGDKPWLNALTKDGELTEIGQKVVQALQDGTRTIEQIEAKNRLNKQEKEYLSNIKRIEQPAAKEPVNNKTPWAQVTDAKKKDLVKNGEAYIRSAYTLTDEESTKLHNYFQSLKQTA
jgi:hypothetical protein